MENNQNANGDKEVEAIIINYPTVEAIIIDSSSFDKEFSMLNKKRKTETRKKNNNKINGLKAKGRRSVSNIKNNALTKKNNQVEIKYENINQQENNIQKNELIRPVLVNFKIRASISEVIKDSKSRNHDMPKQSDYRKYKDKEI